MFYNKIAYFFDIFRTSNLKNHYFCGKNIRKLTILYSINDEKDIL